MCLLPIGLLLSQTVFVPGLNRLSQSLQSSQSLLSLLRRLWEVSQYPQGMSLLQVRSFLRLSRRPWEVSQHPRSRLVLGLIPSALRIHLPVFLRFPLPHRVLLRPLRATLLSPLPREVLVLEPLLLNLLRLLWEVNQYLQVAQNKLALALIPSALRIYPRVLLRLSPTQRVLPLPPQVTRLVQTGLLLRRALVYGSK